MDGIREREKRRVPLGVAASMLSPEVRYAEDEDHVLYIHLAQLHEFEGHTFAVRETSEDFEALVESIKANGIKTPLIVRPYRDIIGEYEIISGHRRCRAAKYAKLETVPVLVRKVDDTQATILMAESNIQRPDWLPSERARTYKMWMDAEKRRTGIKAGRPDNCATQLHNLSKTQQPDNCATELHNLEKGTKIRDRATQRFGVSGQMIDIYIKLNALIPDLLDLVDYNHDNPKCGIQVKSGYQLAFLSPAAQAVVADVWDEYPDRLMREGMAKAIRKKAANANGRLTAMDVRSTLKLDDDATPVKKVKFALPDTFGARMAKHKNDPELLDRISQAIEQYLREKE